MGLEPDGVADATARILITAILFVWNLYEGSVLESPYMKELVVLYGFPLWRLVVVLSVVLATYWCPRVGAMLALTVFFYIEDLEKLSTPWISLRKEESL
jgi:hypothetical protein